jgi:hypothetical protein
MIRLHLVLAMVALSSVLVLPVMVAAREPVNGAQQVLAQLEQVTAALSDTIDRFDHLQDELMNLGRANERYSEQKNIWLSSVLTVAAISAVCEYEADLTTLFMDLKEKNRRHYFDVRIKSLETSIQQVNIMIEQIGINHSLITHSPDEMPLVEREKRLVTGARDLLNRGLELMLQWRQMSRA